MLWWVKIWSQPLVLVREAHSLLIGSISPWDTPPFFECQELLSPSSLLPFLWFSFCSFSFLVFLSFLFLSVMCNLVLQLLRLCQHTLSSSPPSSTSFSCHCQSPSSGEARAPSMDARSRSLKLMSHICHPLTPTPIPLMCPILPPSPPYNTTHSFPACELCAFLSLPLYVEASYGWLFWFFLLAFVSHVNYVMFVLYFVVDA